VQVECQQEQDSLVRTASLGEGAISQGGAEVSTVCAAPEALASAEEGQGAPAQERSAWAPGRDGSGEGEGG